MKLPTILLLAGTALPGGFAAESMEDHAARLATDDRIGMYQALLQARPEDFHYRNLLASSYLQKVRETMAPEYLDRASKIVNDVLAAEGSNYEALRLRMLIELERHQFPKVAEYARELIRRAPDDPANFGALGDALMEMGQYDPAAAAYQKMVALRPDMASYNRAAYYRFVAGDSAGAIEVMKQAIAAGSGRPENTAWCLADLGNMLFKSGRLDEAAQAYELALRLFPTYHPAHAGMGRVEAARGHIDNAIASYLRAQAAVPLPEYAGELEDLYALAGRKEDAAAQARLVDAIDAMERAGNSANRNLALVYADHSRKLDRALEMARAELKVRGDVYTYDALAWVLYQSGQPREAAALLDKFLQLGTPEPAFYYHAGMIERAVGKTEQARRHLERALQLNPHFDTRQAPLAAAALRETIAGGKP